MAEVNRKVFLAKFKEEATERLQKINEGIINLEQDPNNQALLNELLRESHTLKGSARMVGLIEIGEVAHRVEDILVQVKKGNLKIGGENSELLFEALDIISNLTEAAIKGKEASFNIDSFCSKIDRLVKDSGEKIKKEKLEEKEEQLLKLEKREEEEVLQAKLVSQKIETIRVRTSQVDKILNLVGEMVINQIKAEQRIFSVRALASLMGEINSLWKEIKSSLDEDEGEGLLSEEKVNQLEEHIDEMRRRAINFYKEYTEDTSRVSTIVNELQESTMNIRMLPISTIFNTFPRAVREMAKEYGKEINLEIRGAETELDKKVIEEINDPLIHIIRNAVCHGIESVEEREAKGKPRKGKIEITASQEGDHILISIRDDGRGINPSLVKETAIKKGFLSPVEAEAMSELEAQYLIFEPGFTTSQIITDVSGRGIGLDVVKLNIEEKLKGSIQIQSEVDKGTTFLLTLPLTLAIIRALMVKSCDQTFAIPTTSIEETMVISPSEIHRVEGREAIQIRGKSVPIVQLAEVLKLEKVSDELNLKKLPLVIMVSGGQRFGFIVDELLGEQQIVIKSLGSHLRKVENVAGATILGAGEVVIILHPSDLANSAKVITGLKPLKEKTKVLKEKVKRILIVEDSLTTRELERSIFEASGYQVETARDGIEALEKIQKNQFDLVVADIQMPRMDGFELTRKLKMDERYKELPVVIVTSLEKEEEKKKGIEVGANAYILKSAFDQVSLLEVVERLIG